MARLKVNTGRLISSALSLVFVAAFVMSFISREKYIYFWDYYHYWAKYQDLGGLLVRSPLKALSDIVQTIRNDDYNLLPVFFLMPFRVLFGEDRLGYILGIATVYFFPAAVVAAMLVEKSAPRQSGRSLVAWGIALTTFLLFPQNWIPVLFGFPDVAGVAVIGAILLLVGRKPFEEQGFRSLLLLSALLAFMIMLRRWYAYWVVSFFFALSAERIVTLFPRHRFRFREYLPVLKHVIATGILSTGIFFIAASPIAKRMVSTDYAEMYSAYKTTAAIIPFVRDVCGHLGLFASLLFVVALVVNTMQSRTQALSLFLLFHVIGVVFFFSRVQNFSPQHYYLIIPSMILAISVFMVTMAGALRTSAAKAVFFALYLAVLAAQFWIVFGKPAYIDGMAQWVSADRHPPLQRHDLNEMHRLLDALKERVRVGEDIVYVVASSVIINDDILRNACRSFGYERNFCGSIPGASHIDKRDGFPQSFLYARWVVVANPVQYHLSSEGQRIVGVLTDEMTHPRSIGLSYEKEPGDFLLDNNVRVSVYKKVKSPDPSAVQDIQQRFLSYYPGRTDLLTANGQ